MEIVLTHGVGSGPTKLAAFDSALNGAGIANYNLIPLSSVIPPFSRVVELMPKNAGGALWGDRLYTVIQDVRTDEIGQEVWAGLGWVVNGENHSGLFVEHAGHTEAEVEKKIRETLSAMIAYRTGDWGEIQWKAAGIICESEPVAAVVAAVYKSEPW